MLGERGVDLLRIRVWPTKSSRPLAFILAMVCLGNRAISLLTPFEKKINGWILDSYVLAWLAILIVLFAVPPRTGVWGLVVASVALYRLQDLLFSMLDDTLDLTGRFEELIGTNKVIIALVNIMQIVLVFSIVIGVFTTPSDWRNATHLARFHCFVLSWSGLIPFGVSTNAVHFNAQLISIAESVVAVIVLLVALTRFLSLPNAALPGPANPTRGAPSVAGPYAGLPAPVAPPLSAPVVAGPTPGAPGTAGTGPSKKRSTRIDSSGEETSPQSQA